MTAMKGLVHRLAAWAVLGLMAVFCLTAGIDPCVGEADCEDVPCHLVCVDGCTTTPVPQVAVSDAPLRLASRIPRLEKPLRPAPPCVAWPDRPPRDLAS